LGLGCGVCSVWCVFFFPDLGCRVLSWGCVLGHQIEGCRVGVVGLPDRGVLERDDGGAPDLAKEVVDVLPDGPTAGCCVVLTLVKG